MDGFEAEADAEADECWHSLAALLQDCRCTPVHKHKLMPRLNCTITSLKLPGTSRTEAEADVETDECWHSLAARLQHCRQTCVPINEVLPRLNCSITSLTETKADTEADDFLHLH